MQKPNYVKGPTHEQSKRPPCPNCMADMPHLWEFLAHRAWDDGSPRQPGSLTIFIEDGTLKGCLSDRDCDRVCFVSGEGLPALLGALQAGLAGDKLDWRQARKGGKR